MTRWNPQPALERLLARSEPGPGGCLLWTGSLATSGHASIRGDSGKLRGGHVVAWEAVHGEVPSGFDVHHECEVKRCVNVEHLKLVPHGEHVRQHNLGRETCKYGHPLDITQAAPHTATGRQRTCSICRRARWRRWKSAQT